MRVLGLGEASKTLTPTLSQGEREGKASTA